MNLDRTKLRGTLKDRALMARHTSWKIGGYADLYYQAASADDLAYFLVQLPADMPVTWIGLGSNLLIRDGGVRGAVVSVARCPGELKRLDDTQLRVGAGLPCAKLAHFAAGLGLGGVEFLSGIPGTIGGALAMNAGAYGGEIWDFVEEVETINRAGIRRWRAKHEFSIAYRHVVMPADEWFLSAVVRLYVATKSAVLRSMQKILSARSLAQPLGQYSCGSVFKNPGHDSAARLIDDCGLRGMKIGGAEVSQKHANFIINTDKAAAADIEYLISMMQSAVYEKHTVQLVPEVRIVGEARSMHD